ncbi:catecholate siderophore receptor Fiu [Lampropedia aestuarii]|nr:catecholate siderophore receptor Fiu [Lampropedia aestuarii]
MAYIKGRKHQTVRGVTGSAAYGLLTGMALSLPVLAQPNAANPNATQAEQTLSEVQVIGDENIGYKVNALSSDKFTQPVLDTTQTVTIVPQQVMREQTASTLTDVLRNVSGMGTFSAGEGAGPPSMGDAIIMRGFDAKDSIYVDNVRDTGTISRDVFNTEAVEVFKGPAGTDAGRSAPNGAINLVTKQARKGNFSDLSIGAGTARYKRSTLDLNRELDGLPNAAFRLNLMGEDAGVAGRDRITNRRWGIAPALAMGLGTPTRTYLNVQHVRQNNVPDAGIPTVGLSGFSGNYAPLGNMPEPRRKNFYGSSSDRDKSESTMATLRFEHDLASGAALRNTTRWAKTSQDFLATFSAFPVMPISPDPNALMLQRQMFSKDVSNEIYTNQTNLNTEFQTGALTHEVSMGLELTREQQINYGQQRTPTALPPINAQNPSYGPGANIVRTGENTRGRTDTLALYAFDTIKLDARWQLNGGLRLDRYKTTFRSVNDSISASDNLLTWKAGVLYKPASNGSMYANYAVAQQPPGSSTFSLVNSMTTMDLVRGIVTDANMKPQKAKTVELGTKWELFNRSLLLTGALFRTDVDNEVEIDSSGEFNQIGKKRVQGLELSASGSITRDWDMLASYTYQKTKVVRGVSAVADGSSGLGYAPKNSLSLWSTYRISGAATVGAGGRYDSGFKRWVRDYPSPEQTPSYWTMDAMASYRFNAQTDLQLNVFNLFDKQYVAAINHLGLRYIPGLGRSARVTLNFQF